MSQKKFFSYKEMIDAKIYDSTGLFYGYLCGFEIGGSPYIKACLKFSVGEYIPDTEKLREMLIRRGLEVPEELTLEELIVAARNEGLEIPRIKVVRGIELVKGYIRLNDIGVIDLAFMKRYDSYDSRIAVIVLNKPREAYYRGLDEKINEPILEQANRINGKLVVSLGNGIVGFVKDIVFSMGELGIRTYSELYREGTILLNNYLTMLHTRKLDDIVSIIENEIGNSEKIDLSLYGYVYHVLKKNGAPPEAFQLLNSSVEFEEIILEKYRDISWKEILKVGDIIITR